MSAGNGGNERERRTEWRVCGSDPGRGPWIGPWYASEPSDHDVQQLAKRNAEVWVERREVWESKPVRVNAIGTL